MTDPMLQGLRDQLINGAVQHRRRRRQLTVTAAALLVALIGLGSYVFAIGDPEDDRVTTDSTIITDTTTTTTTTATTTPTTTTADVRTLDYEQIESAESIVSRFMDEIRRGDLAAAAQRWTGYSAAVELDGPSTDRIPFIEDLVDDPEFARILESDTEMFVTPSWAMVTHPLAPVVTVLAPGDSDNPPGAVAFLVDTSPWAQDQSSELHIQRIPLPSAPQSEPNPPNGSAVIPGQEVVVPVFPIEGAAHVHVNGIEVPSNIDFSDPLPDSQGLPLTFTIPDSASGHIAVTLSIATPELPQVQAFAYVVRGR